MNMEHPVSTDKQIYVNEMNEYQPSNYTGCTKIIA